MAGVQIQIDQPGSGAPPGTPGQAREDLVTGFAVQLSAIGGPFLAYAWSIIDKAIDIETPAISGALLGAPLAAVTPFGPIDIVGTYDVQVLVDSGSGLGALDTDIARITFYAGVTLNALNPDPAELPRREMAFRETTEHNVPDALFPLGNPRGWAEERQRWQAVLTRMYRGKSWAWGNINVAPGGPATVTKGFNLAGAIWVAPGVVDITFTIPLPNADYAVVPGAEDTGGMTSTDTRTANGFRLYRSDEFGVLADRNFTFEVKDQL